MNKKILYIAGGLIGAVVIVMVVVALFIGRTEDTGETDISTPDTGSLPESGNIAVDETLDEPSLAGVPISDPNFQEQVLIEDLKKRSSDFIERLGSYSSDSLLTNFDDVLPQTSPAFEGIVRDFKASRLLEYSQSQSYIGYMVEAVAVDITGGVTPGNTITIVIEARREITSAAQPAGVKINQTYIVSWKQGEDRTWRVDAVSGNF